MSTHLYGLTVQGIQSYIFETNKLKEIVGASEIIELACTTWFNDFIRGNNIGDGSISYLQAAGNIRFQTSEENAKTIYKLYHKELLQKAPGVPFSQAVVQINGDAEKAIEALDKRLRARRNIPMQNFDLGSMGRFIARGTGAAAIFLDSKADAEVKKKREAIDIATYEKFKKGSNSNSILRRLDPQYLHHFHFPTDFETIANNSKHSWLALVHIDGNGMGHRINDMIKEGKNVFGELKSFSVAIAACTQRALKTALDEEIIDQIGEKDEEKKDGKKVIPFRPIILGGDDVTAIMRADFAIPFVKRYLEEFESETSKNETLNKTEELAESERTFTACAGIAFVKEKFPFHFAADLAEQLTGYAKDESGRTASCLHFHRVQDSFTEEYDEIKLQLSPRGEKEGFFVNGPYYLKKQKDSEKPTIEDLLKDCKKLNKEGSPINGMREWVDLKFNNPLMAKEVKSRIKANSRYENYRSILEKENAFVDYQTLLAVNTEFPSN